MRRGYLVLVGLAVQAAVASGQRWNDERALTLVRQATARRVEQLADSGLVDYHATAHGYVTFLAQLGEGFREPPQIVKADELALEVYWRAPNLSKQLIVGRRDTTLLPTDIQYHRDHLGIVQNNFPAIIRVGEGDEVRDVPHPLSPQGLADYDFALTDSLRITIPGRVISVYEVKIRPKNDRLARVIGALYLDRDNGQVVRMALSFTRAAFLDDQLEDLFIVLENGLVGTRFWLPRRQEVEIRRTATWLDYPVRGIIRGRWEIGTYELNIGIPRQQFIGPEIVQLPAATQRPHQWPSAAILDSLPPDVRAVTADEIRRVQDEVRSLVRAQALRRVRASALAARGISDFARVTRVEGLALGAGLSGQLGGGWSVAGRARYGFDDRAFKGAAELRWEMAHGIAVRAHASRDHVDAGDVPERSTLVNSLAAQEAGSDFTDPYWSLAYGASLALPFRGMRLALGVVRERQHALAIHAAPAAGRFESLLPADSITATRVGLGLDRPAVSWPGGVEARARLTAQLWSVRANPGCASTHCAATSVLRAAADLELARQIGATRLVARTVGGGARGSDHLPSQLLVFAGGPVTAPGYDFHTLVGSAAVSQRLELQLPVPFPPLSLGRFGRSAARATFAPFVTAVALRPPDAARASYVPPVLASDADRLFGRRADIYPSTGAGLLLFFDILRLDVARGLRHGRWSFSVDLQRTFWGVL